MTFESHIAVLAFPFGTHATPLLTLVQRLAASAPATRFSFFNSAASNTTTFPEHLSSSYKNIHVYEVWDGTPEGQAFTGTHFEAVGLFIEASPGNFEKAIEEAEEESGLRVTCLIADAFLWFACDVAERRRVPWLAFWASATFSLSAHLYTDHILNASGSTGDEAETVSFIPGLSKVHYTDLPPEVFRDKNPSPLSTAIYNMVQKIPKSRAIVLNCFEEIEPHVTEDLKSKFQNVLNVGPSFLSSPAQPSPGDDKNGCLSWLERQTRPESVVYISFGSVITPPEGELVALAEALETCRFPFLWSLKGEARKSLPEGFVGRTKELGKIVGWAPQLQVLAHSSVGVFITHGGYNSFLESISIGVPMICRPFFGDQMIDSRMVEDGWRVGVTVQGGVFSKTGTIAALNRVMSSEEGKEMRDNVSLLKERAASAVKLDGTSTKNFHKLLEIINS